MTSVIEWIASKQQGAGATAGSLLILLLCDEHAARGTNFILVPLRRSVLADRLGIELDKLERLLAILERAGLLQLHTNTSKTDRKGVGNGDAAYIVLHPNTSQTRRKEIANASEIESLLSYSNNATLIQEEGKEKSKSVKHVSDQFAKRRVDAAKRQVQEIIDRMTGPLRSAWEPFFKMSNKQRVSGRTGWTLVLKQAMAVQEIALLHGEQVAIATLAQAVRSEAWKINYLFDTAALKAKNVKQQPAAAPPAKSEQNKYDL